MKYALIIFFLSMLLPKSFGQILKSGEYGNGMIISFDEENALLTGYFESYTGWDEETKSPKFSCIFYIEGVVNDKIVKVDTYHTEYKLEDKIGGIVTIINDSSYTIQLPEEHGGCWNVYHFADSTVEYTLRKEEGSKQVRYVISKLAYFYSEKSDDNKLNSYVIKNDLLRVEKIEGKWAFCSYYGEKTTSGWIKLNDLNKIDSL